MKVIREIDDDKGINLYMEDGSHFYTPWEGQSTTIIWLYENPRGVTRQAGQRRREQIMCAYVVWLQSRKNVTWLLTNDKEVYFNKKWQPAKFISQKGMAVTVTHQDYGTVVVPFVHVRDSNPLCEECEEHLFRGSFQTNKGTSYCFTCYRCLDAQELELLFNGPQWMAWEGQMSMRSMEQSHLVNSLNRMRGNASKAAEAAGGKPEDYLHPAFEHMVEELHNRRPMTEKIKVNHYLLYVWSILFMVFGGKNE